MWSKSSGRRRQGYRRRIGSLSQLETALKDGSLIGLPGIGEKKAEKLKRGIQLLKQRKGRINLGVAVARRGWLETGDVLHTLSIEEIFSGCHR